MAQWQLNWAAGQFPPVAPGFPGLQPPSSIPEPPTGGWAGGYDGPPEIPGSIPEPPTGGFSGRTTPATPPTSPEPGGFPPEPPLETPEAPAPEPSPALPPPALPPSAPPPMGSGSFALPGRGAASAPFQSRGIDRVMRFGAGSPLEASGASGSMASSFPSQAPGGAPQTLDELLQLLGQRAGSRAPKS